MGTVIEKTQTRWGKARPWLLIGSIPLSLSMVLMFTVPEGFSQSGKQAYIYITYIFMAVICYTMVNLSYHAILPRFSPDQHDRTVTRTITLIMGLVQVLIISGLTPWLLSNFGGESNQRAWTIVATIYAVLALICLLICFFGAKEQIPVSVTANEEKVKTPILPTLKMLGKTKYFYIILTIMTVSNISTGCSSGGLIYYVKDVLGDMNYYGLMSIAGAIPMVIVIPFVPLIVKKVGRRRIVVIGMAINVIVSAVQLIRPDNLMLVLVCSIVRAIATLPFTTILFTLSADVVDYVEWKKGVRAEGLITSVNSFGMKVGTGLGAAMLGWILAWGNYDAMLVKQTAATLTSINVVVIVIPLLCNLAILIAMSFWDIDKYRSEIAAFQSGMETTAD